MTLPPLVLASFSNSSEGGRPCSPSPGPRRASEPSFKFHLRIISLVGSFPSTPPSPTPLSSGFFSPCSSTATIPLQPEGLPHVPRCSPQLSASTAPQCPEDKALAIRLGLQALNWLLHAQPLPCTRFQQRPPPGPLGPTYTEASPSRPAQPVSKMPHGPPLP